MMSKAKVGLATLGLASAMAFTGPALAQDTGFYAGLHIGQSKAKDACEDLTSCDDKDTAWKILGGYQFNRHLAVEIGYTDLGEVSATDLGATVSIESTAFEVVAVGIFPVANQFSVYGKLGMYRGDTDTSVSDPGGSASGSESNTDLTFGIGVRYDFTRNLGVRAEWQKYSDVSANDLDGGTVEADVDVISVGVIWRF
jgi:OOP family OmpA-OmpF porin